MEAHQPRCANSGNPAGTLGRGVGRTENGGQWEADLFRSLAAGRTGGAEQNSNRNGSEDFVFCKEDGSPLNPDVLRRDVLYPTLDRLGITRTSRAAGFHTFRRSAATIFNQKTGNLKLVQKLLGHSNLSTTADVYTHTSADADRSAALALEEAIFGDLFQVVPRLGTWNKNAAPN